MSDDTKSVQPPAKPRDVWEEWCEEARLEKETKGAKVPPASDYQPSGKPKDVWEEWCNEARLVEKARLEKQAILENEVVLKNETKRENEAGLEIEAKLQREAKAVDLWEEWCEEARLVEKARLEKKAILENEANQEIEIVKVDTLPVGYPHKDAARSNAARSNVFDALFAVFAWSVIGFWGLVFLVLFIPVTILTGGKTIGVLFLIIGFIAKDSKR